MDIIIHIMINENKNNFQKKVLFVVSKIKKGSTLSYKQVAEKSGNKKAYRAVGSIMRKNKDKKIPCHRVIKSNNTAGEYNNGGSFNKIKKLQSEGVSIYK